MKFCVLLLSLFFGLNTFAQSKIAITIDDVPNTSKFKRDHFESKLLNVLDSLELPITIFINEGRIYRTDSVSLNFDLLVNWCKRDYMTLANHTYAHSRYSAVGLDSFKLDIDRGAGICRELARKYGKAFDEFRFPYNDLGKDSLQHAQIHEYLDSKGYNSTPFTVESSDWMYNYVYKHYLKSGQTDSAQIVAQDYITQTLNLFDFYDSLALEIYDRPVDHIYLCHDNEINADYLAQLVDALKQRKYSFSSLKEVLKDPIYGQKDVYYKKWGISWFYRWMTDSKERQQYMHAEPQLDFIYNTYERLKN